MWYLLLGPMISALCNRYSYRTVIMCSGIVLGFSAMISAFAPNLYFLFLSYGVIGGNIYLYLTDNVREYRRAIKKDNPGNGNKEYRR